MPPISGADYWKRIERLFYEALEKNPSTRLAFLDEACGNDEALRKEVESLLHFSDKTFTFVERAVGQMARRATGESQPPGATIGHYQISKMLGQGGMGEVYLATRSDDSYQQEVAIKVMRNTLQQTGVMLLRFSAERQILANLNHPNIARLLDGGVTQDGLPYLVMEYVDGTPIEEYCRGNRLTVPDRLELFRTVCGAVEYAHKNLIVHRDIKPGNILVTKEGIPKLLDFGIAKLLDPTFSDLQLTKSVDRVMTPEYASPEQVRGDVVTTSTDVYGLGVLLYEVLTGRQPFRSENQSSFELARAICEQEPKLPSAVVRQDHQDGEVSTSLELSRELDNIVLMAMRKEPARRYVSVNQLSKDVQAFLDGFPVEASAGTWAYRCNKFMRRNRAAVTAAAVVVLTLVGFSIGMGLLAKRATRARATAEQQRLTAQREAQFLASIFDAATPDQAKGREVTARELLDQGAKRIETELASEPEAQATMLNNVGKAYTSLGRYEQARPLLERAYKLRSEKPGAGNVDLAETAQALGNIYKLQADYQKAEPLFRQALTIRENGLGEQNQLVSETLTDLGECLFLENRVGDAEALLRKALALEGSKESALSAATRNQLALVVKRKGDFAEQVQLLQDAVRIEKVAEGVDSPSYAIVLQNLASAQMDQGNLLAGEATEREALAIRRKISGNDHPELAYALNNLGWVLLAKGDWKDALPILWEALQIRRKALGERHPLYVASLVIWGRAMHAKGDDVQAAKFYREATQILQESDKNDNWTLAQILADLAWLHMDEKDYIGAERYAEQALNMRRRLGGAESVDFASSLIDLAMAKAFQGNLAEAETSFRQALSIREKKFPLWHPRVIYVEIRLGEVLMREHKLQLAEPLLREAANSAHSAPFALLSWQIAEADNAFGSYLVALGHRSEGAALLQASEPSLKAIPLRSRYR